MRFQELLEKRGFWLCGEAALHQSLEPYSQIWVILVNQEACIKITKFTRNVGAL